MRKLVYSILISILMALMAASASAQSVPAVAPASLPAVKYATSPVADVTLPSVVPPLPRMAPELALQVFMQRTTAQPEKLAAYTDTTVVEAELPDTSQKGEYELIRSFTAPHSLSFATVKFTGDSFVKTNVIVRLLQQEVDHTEKGNAEATAISDKNYKFNYRGVENVDGKLCHVYQLKPRKKVQGLFKGRIYVDAYSGSLRRAEGTLMKSPSFFVKNVNFVQDFTDVAGFTFPARLRSTAKARIIGRAVVNIFHKEYKLQAKTDSLSNVPAAEALVPTGSTH